MAVCNRNLQSSDVLSRTAGSSKVNRRVSAHLKMITFFIIKSQNTFRSYRGQAYAKMGRTTEALQDLSAAIHLDPNNYENFYLRGAMLRKAAPKKATQDLSVSLMLNNTEKNALVIVFAF